MYDITVECSYNTIENPVEANTLYQEQFLKAFGLAEYEQKAVDRETNTVYIKMQNAPGIQGILQDMKKSKMGVFCVLFSDTDEAASNEFAFVCLFGYDLFHVFHRCICEYYTTHTIQDESIDALKKEIGRI
jgi:hypothetical protein